MLWKGVYTIILIIFFEIMKNLIQNNNVFLKLLKVLKELTICWSINLTICECINGIILICF